MLESALVVIGEMVDDGPRQDQETSRCRNLLGGMLRNILDDIKGMGITDRYGPGIEEWQEELRLEAIEYLFDEKRGADDLGSASWLCSQMNFPLWRLRVKALELLQTSKEELGRWNYNIRG